MPARHLILPLLALLALAGCSTPGGTEAERTGRVRTFTGDLPALVTGMTTEEVRLRLGAPAEIKPMTSSGVTAETWVYYFEKTIGPTTVFNGAMSSPSGSLAGDYSRSGLGVDYLVVERRLLVTLRLLMVNGQLTARTAQSEERLQF